MLQDIIEQQKKEFENLFTPPHHAGEPPVIGWKHWHSNESMELILGELAISLALAYQEGRKEADNFPIQIRDENGEIKSLEAIMQESKQEGRKEAWKELGVEGMKHELGQTPILDNTKLETRKEGYNQALSDLTAKAKTLNLE